MNERKEELKQNKLKLKNRKAFEKVMDAYETMKYRSLIPAADYSKNKSAGSAPNLSRPTISDFIAAVEMAQMAVERRMERVCDQTLGAEFRRRKLYPVSQFFETIRQRSKW